MGWTTGVEVRVLVGSRIFSTSLRPFLEPTQPPIQWVPGALTPGVKRPRREAGHSQIVPSGQKKCGYIHQLPHKPSRRSAYLVKHRGNFTFSIVSQVLWSLRTELYADILHKFQLYRIISLFPCPLHISCSCLTAFISNILHPCSFCMVV
jgi:hypothetical protein